MDRCHVRLREGGSFWVIFFYCLGTEAEQGPVGYAAATGFHSRGYGGCERAGEEGDVTETLKKKTKRRKSFN